MKPPAASINSSPKTQKARRPEPAGLQWLAFGGQPTGGVIEGPDAAVTIERRSRFVITGFS
ncbi:hypothetical protein ASE05_24750 [Mesorhizobium sp. Root172]|uniref:Uncharacterized protein n=1 Tax=Rhizobium loti TaxID=381 RepID=A0AA91J0C5_RHILI|nr:hypothetical protein ASE05_24750 [Mesorhizobium sp. Root172]OBQ59850.1 hypothetical protein A8145_24785 [Mesorhizobium loti]